MSMITAKELKVGDAVYIRPVFDQGAYPVIVNGVEEEGDLIWITWNDGVRSPIRPDQHITTIGES